MKVSLSTETIDLSLVKSLHAEFADETLVCIHWLNGSETVFSEKDSRLIFMAMGLAASKF